MTMRLCKDRRSVVVMTESWQVCSCRFEPYLAQYHSRCGDTLVGRPLTPWLINKLARGPPKVKVWPRVSALPARSLPLYTGLFASRGAGN